MDNYLFSALKVIDAATVIAAPAAAMMLADFGADVIKIEQPGAGDMLRIIRDVQETVPGGEDYMWQMDGHSKRGIALDLKAPAGMEILRKLVAECDVFITNHPLSVRDSLGINYDDLKPLNPAMIYASLTAYGEEGPERARKGFDQLAYWARSGLMDLMRARDAAPVQGLSGMGDHPTGVALYAGIVTALLNRERTGAGSMVHTSLLANGLWSCSAIAQGASAGGDVARFRDMREEMPAMMQVYQCSDGRWLQLNMVRNTELMSLLFVAMDTVELLSDPRFADPMDMWDNRVALGVEIGKVIIGKTSTEWMTLFDEYNVPANLIAVVEEKPDDPQARINNMIIEPEDPEMGVPLLVKHPIQIDNIPQRPPRRPPHIGEHSADILRELGYDPAEIEQLFASGVIEAP